jgi:hypothetical protein
VRLYHTSQPKMLLRICCLLSFLFAAPCTKAAHYKGDGPRVGQIIFPGAQVMDPDGEGSFNTLVIPIKRAQNLIIIQAKIDSTEGNFILDTGAPYLVLNQTYFRDAVHYGDMDESGGINGNASAFHTLVQNFNIAELKYDRLQADVTDLSAIENSRGIRVLGLLGTKLFSKFAITVDLFQNVLYIHKLDKDGNIPAGEQVYHDPFLKVPFRYLDNAIYLKAEIGDNTFWFAFDTGAETNLIDYRLSKKIMQSVQIINRSKLTGIGGSTYELIYARFDKLFIGGRTFENNKFLIASMDKMGKSYGHSVDGMLGFDFFARGVFTINFVKKEFEMYIDKQ